MNKLQKTIYKLIIPMIILLPLWLVVGRALLGSLGWLTIFLVLMVLPVLTAIQIIFAFMVMRRPDVRRTKIVSPRDAQYLTIFYASVFLFGLFLVDGGDTEDSINSVATNLLGGWFEPASHWLSIIFFWVSVAMIIACFVLFARERRALRAATAK